MFRGRRFTRRPSQRRRQYVWTAALNSQTVTGGTVHVQVMADSSNYFNSAANAKHAGTLLRIRGNINILDQAATGQPNQFGIGIVIADGAERQLAGGIQSPLGVAFGQDEDVLFWWVGRVPAEKSVAGDDANFNLPIDIKAKRRLSVEEEVCFVCVSGATGGVLVFQNRCLIQLG